MATAKSHNKYDGEPKTAIEVYQEFLYHDWDLIEDMAKNATDATTLFHLVQAAICCWHSYSDSISDIGDGLIYSLKENPHLPENAKQLIGKAEDADKEDVGTGTYILAVTVPKTDNVTEITTKLITRLKDTFNMVSCGYRNNYNEVSRMFELPETLEYPEVEKVVKEILSKYLKENEYKLEIF